jgi:hypothetical protein
MRKIGIINSRQEGIEKKIVSEKVMPRMSWRQEEYILEGLRKLESSLPRGERVNIVGWDCFKGMRKRWWERRRRWFE